MNQTFTCDRCQTKGSVKIRLYEGVYSVAQKIAQRHSELKPECSAGLSEIQAHSQLGIIKTQKAAAK